MTDKDRFVTEEDMEAVKRACFEFWAIEDPDVIEAYHAWQILKIKSESARIHSFDDFVVSWKAHGGR